MAGKGKAAATAAIADQTISGDGTGEALAPIGGGEREGAPVENSVNNGDESPVEDHVTAFERRIDRLTEIALEAEFAGGSLVGDIRDALLDAFKHRPKPWSQMSADEMRDMNKGLETIAKTLIRKIVLVVAEEDDVSVPAILKGYSVKGDAFALKIEAKGDEDTALELFRMDGHDVVILRADAKRFHGQKREAEVIDDQASLEFADAAPKPAPEHPSDDSDLAGIDTGRIAKTGDKLDVEGAGTCELSINLTTGMVVATPIKGGAMDGFDLSEATPEELAFERERVADFDDDED